VLQAGSVIEREFSYDLIKRVTGLPEQQLLTHLSALKDSELLYERGVYPKTSYIFKHALTREVIYDSILSKKKKELHEQIGKGIEELYKDNLTEHYEVLAEHFFVSENYAQAAEYSRLAGKKAEKSASFTDAISNAKKGVACLERLPRTDEVQKKITNARTALGLYFIQLNYPIKAKEAIDPVIDSALRIGHKHRLPIISTILGIYEFEVEENLPKALNHFEEALKISEETKDILSLFFTNYSLGLTLMWSCAFEKASYHFEKALEINMAANSLWGISVMKALLSYVNLLQGNINLGYKASAEALRMAEDSGDIYSKSIAYSIHGLSYLCKGFFAEAEKYLLKGIEFCERINFFIWNTLAQEFLGEMDFQIREYENSRSCYEKAICFLEQAEFGPSRGNFYRIGLARAKVMSNEGDINLEYLFGYVEKNKIRELEGVARRFIGEILLNIDDQHGYEAEEWIQKAIEADQRNGMRFTLGIDYALYAELFKRKGDRLKAQENLGKAIEILKECGADGWVSKYEKELALIS
jgi:tetratricopeptide (TPR) repeat protein